MTFDYSYDSSSAEGSNGLNPVTSPPFLPPFFLPFFGAIAFFIVFVSKMFLASKAKVSSTLKPVLALVLE
jgi:hypothetical protein